VGRRIAALGVALAFSALVIILLANSDSSTDDRRLKNGIRPLSVAGVELFPVPRPVLVACRSAQEQASVPLLCPVRLPRAVRDLAGSSALPRLPLAPLAITNRTGSVSGISFGYSGETGDPRRDRPERFLHFEVLEQREPLPPGVRPATLGGRSGLLAPTSRRDYGSETYWANHVRFFFSERGVKYAATLHDFGPDTVRVLAALVAGLRPADRLRPARQAPMDGRVETIPLPIHGPVSVVAGVGGQVWVAGQGDAGSFAAPGESHRPSLVRIDPDRRRVVGNPVPIHFADGTVAISNGAARIWVAHRAAESRPLRLFNPGSARFVGSVRGRPEAVAVAVGPDRAWVVDFGPESRSYRHGWLRRTETGPVDRFLASVPVGRAPAGVTDDGRGVWVTNELDDTVTRIDPRTNRVVETARVGDGPTGVTATSGAIWVANGEDGTVSRIDPRANHVVATIRVGRRPRGLTGGHGSLWVTNELDDTVSRIDPATNKVAEIIPVGAGPAGLAYGEGAVWVANNLDQTVSRIEP